MFMTAWQFPTVLAVTNNLFIGGVNQKCCCYNAVITKVHIQGLLWQILNVKLTKKTFKKREEKKKLEKYCVRKHVKFTEGASDCNSHIAL